MQYLRTTLATDWQLAKSFSLRLIERVLWFIPKANPDYEANLHLVKEWLIEFAEDGLPCREIGLDKDGNFVLAGPNSTNYGFWLDTNMKYKDFTGTACTSEVFNKLWREAW